MCVNLNSYASNTRDHRHSQTVLLDFAGTYMTGYYLIQVWLWKKGTELIHQRWSRLSFQTHLYYIVSHILIRKHQKRPSPSRPLLLFFCFVPFINTIAVWSTPGWDSSSQPFSVNFFLIFLKHKTLFTFFL